MAKKRIRPYPKGLTTICVMLPSELWKRLKLRVIRDRTSIRAVVVALATAYIEGEFEYEKEETGSKEKA
jgi:hypothetical protein